jgi:hypothetical protein
VGKVRLNGTVPEPRVFRALPVRAVLQSFRRHGPHRAGGSSSRPAGLCRTPWSPCSTWSGAGISVIKNEFVGGLYVSPADVPDSEQFREQGWEASSRARWSR